MRNPSRLQVVGDIWRAAPIPTTSYLNLMPVVASVSVSAIAATYSFKSMPFGVSLPRRLTAHQMVTLNLVVMRLAVGREYGWFRVYSTMLPV